MAGRSGGRNGSGNGNGSGGKANGCKPNGRGNGNGNGKVGGNLLNGLPLGLGKLSPQQLAVITALLSNALIVDSVLVDKDQEIQIVLSGSLRRKNKTDKLLEEISGITVGELLDAIGRR